MCVCTFLSESHLRVDNPGDGSEAALEADEIEAEADEYHGRIDGGTVARHEPSLPSLRVLALARGGLLVPAVSAPGHAGALLRSSRARGVAVATVQGVVLPGAVSAGPEPSTQSGSIELPQGGGQGHLGRVRPATDNTERTSSRPLWTYSDRVNPTASNRRLIRMPA